MSCIVSAVLAASGVARAEDFLAPTADADSADPFVVAQAGALGGDPAQIFGFVRDEIAYESYRGSLRGARGTLWSRAGNALDRASLLIALLRAAGVPARYAQGTLSDERAQQLVLSMFPRPARVFGCLEPGTQLADPAQDARLLAEARDHFWVQIDAGEGFADADPAFAEAQVGQSFTTADQTFAEVPDSLRHEVRLRLRRELVLPGALLLGGGPGGDVATVLDQTFAAVRLVGRSLSVGHFVSAVVQSAIFTLQTNTYAPYVIVNQRDGDVGDDDLIRGTDYQEVLSNFPFGSQVLTGVFLDVTTSAPQAYGGDASTVTRTIVDRIGTVARRQGGGTVDIPPDGAPALDDADIVTLEIGAAHQVVEALLPQQAVVQQTAAELAALRATVGDPEAAPDEVRQRLVALARRLVLDSTSFVGGTVALVSDGVRAELPVTALARGYFDAPRVIAVANRVDPGPPALGRFSIDILDNRFRAEPGPLQARQAATVLRTIQGLVDSLIESLVIEPDPASGSVSTSSITILLAAIARPGTRVLEIRADDAAALEPAPLSDEAKARIRDALAAGKTVLVPDRMVELNGRERIAWLERDALGNAIAVSDDGEHQGTTERTFVNMFAKIHAERLEAQLALEAAEESAAAAGEAAANPQNVRQGICLTLNVAAKGLFGGSTVATPAGSSHKWVCPQDPPIGDVLFGATEPTAEFAGLAGAGGVAIAAMPDPVLTVPLGGAQAPTVFRVGVKNLGAVPDSFAIAPEALPAGFTTCQSVPGLTLGPGETGEMTVALIPDGTLPPSGTSASFAVRATSVASPGSTASTSPTFAMPAVHALTLASVPSELASTPGMTATATIRVTAAGNEPESVTWRLDLPPGLAATTPTPVSLAPGETVTRSIGLTPAAGTPLGVTLTAALTAQLASGPEETLLVPVRVVVPGAVAIAAASVAAEQLGDDGLADRLRELASALTELAQDPGDPVARSQALASLDALLARLTGDPGLAALSAALEQAREVLAAADSASAVLAALTALADALEPLADALRARARHGFQLLLSPSSAVAQPQSPSRLTLVLRNVGTETSTYAFEVDGLPPDVSASFDPPTITLAPGEVVPRAGRSSVTLSLTPTSSTELLPVAFVVRALVQQAPDEQRTAAGSLSVRREVVSVVDVRATPAFTRGGAEVQVTTRVLNAANRVRSAIASFVVQDAAGAAVAASALQPVELALASSLQTIELGPLDTTGFADGTYRIAVALTEADGTPIPGASGAGTLLVGSPVAASTAVAPQVLAPGDGTVTTTLEIDSTLALGEPFRLLGLVDTSDPGEILVVGGLVLYGELAYACSTEDVSIVDVSNPSAPVVVGSFADDVVNAAAGTACTIENDHLYVVTTRDGGSEVVTFSLADPLNPAQVGFELIPYNFVSDVFVHRGHLFAATDGVFFFLGGVNSIFRQFGDFLAVLVDRFPGGVTDVVFDTTGPSLGGLSNFWQVTRVTDDIAYVAGSTSQAGNTQLGNGRLLVVDISDPTNLVVLKDLAIPGTVQATGIAVQGGHALVAGSSGGWRNPFTPGFSDFSFTGNLTLTSLDVTDPADPQIVGDTLVTGFGPIVTTAFAYPAGAGRYLLSGLEAGGLHSVALVDANDPADLAVAAAPIPAQGLRDARGFAIAGDRFYTLTSLGLAVFELSGVASIPVTASVRVPRGTGVEPVAGSFSIPPTQTIAGGDFDTLRWELTLDSTHHREAITWDATLTGLMPGEARDVTGGATVEFSVAGAPGEIELPALAVGVGSILAITPASRTVRPAEDASYVVRVTNPGTAPATYDLAVQGVAADWVDLAANVTVEPGTTLDVALRLSPTADGAPGTYAFTVSASSDGAADAVGATLVVAGEPVETDAPPRGVVVGVAPATQSSGRGADASYAIRVTNTGAAPDTFALDVAGLPAGVSATLGASLLAVPPGAGAYQETTLVLTPSPAIAPGAVSFSVHATSTSDAGTTDEAASELVVLPQGVGVSLDPPSGPPGTVFTMTITNAGSTTDTFDLAVAGALATTSTLATNTVNLAPGAAQQVAITLDPLATAPPGSVPLVALATSRSSAAARDAATALVVFGAARGFDAAFVPAAVVLPAPGDAAFVLGVDNVGNVEDAYRATIVGTSGPVAATLRGLAGERVQDVERFVLPGRASGALALDATLTAPGTGTVTVRVTSLADPSGSVEATATLGTGPAPTPSPSPTATPSPTRTPGPTPNGTPSADPFDAFKCYHVRTATGTPQLPALPGVVVSDAFETIVAEVVREKRLCNPVAIGDQPPRDPATHLACYALRPAPGQELLTPGSATIENRFGVQTVRFLGESNDRTLCVPAEAHRAGTEPGAAGELASLRCRAVRSHPSATLRPTPEIELLDEFETRRMRVRRIDSLCTVATRSTARSADSSAALACYHVAQVPRQPAFRPPGTVELASELGTQSVIVRNGRRMVCVPTRLR